MLQTDPCILLIFGASGDLTQRKLVPAMYEMHVMGQLHPATVVLGTARREKTDDAWRDELKPWVAKSARGFDEAKWNEFAKRIFYIAGDGTKAEFYQPLDARLSALAKEHGTRGNLLIFLSVAETLYEPIVEQIDAAGLVVEGKRWCSLDPSAKSWQRIIVEKPFGRDSATAISLNRTLGRAFEEESIYRIDHYLGKELVQSLLVLRFGNSIFEPLWNCQYIDHVQITAAETVSVGQRTAFYDATGAIRDMIQSHLFQILAFVAMEPPSLYTPENVRAEKIKIIDAISIPEGDEVARHCALGQFAADSTEGAYDKLVGVAPGSTTETYAAIKVHFDNWRWAGTPFYIRSGKKLATKRTEVVVQFKPPAANLFRKVPGFGGETPNRLVIEVAPRERLQLRFEVKVPGFGLRGANVDMELDYADHFKAEPIEAYGPLIVDAMRGDQTLFKHRIEVEGAWNAVMPFLDQRSAMARSTIHANYACGSWGPASADELLGRDGRAWRNEA